MPNNTNAFLQFQFETEKEACVEDSLRARRIRRVLATPGPSGYVNFRNRMWLALQHSPRVRPPKLDRKAAADLAERLENGVRGPLPPATLASSLRMRDLRRGLSRHLLDAFAPFADEELCTATVIYTKWAYKPATLDQATARQIRDLFRQHLNRAGVSAIPGPLFAVLHGEYEPRSGIYQIHFHIVTTVAKAAAIRAGLRASRIAGYAKTATGASPVRCPKLKDRVRQFSYLAKAYWPGKPVIVINGKPKRLRDHRRIPEPFATQVLLWLDRQRFADLVVMQGCWSPRNGGTAAMRALYLFVLGACGRTGGCDDRQAV